MRLCYPALCFPGLPPPRRWLAHLTLLGIIFFLEDIIIFKHQGHGSAMANLQITNTSAPSFSRTVASLADSSEHIPIYELLRLSHTIRHRFLMSGFCFARSCLLLRNRLDADSTPASECRKRPYRHPGMPTGQAPQSSLGTRTGCRESLPSPTNLCRTDRPRTCRHPSWGGATPSRPAAPILGLVTAREPDIPRSQTRPLAEPEAPPPNLAGQDRRRRVRVDGGL